MNWVIGICFSLLFFYALILLWLATGFLRTLKLKAPKTLASIPVTIIISARNEGKTIAHCLRSIRLQQYDQNKIQLILVDDASRDGTAAKAEKELKGSALHYQVLHNAQKMGKKSSITRAMALADNELIILRDADTYTRSAYWLQAVTSFYQTSGPDLIIGPVGLTNNNGVLWALQAIETNLLALVTCGSSFYNVPFLCSGANLAFKKNLFEQTKGYSSHMDQTSGDDIFFLEDAKKIAGTKIRYLKSTDAIVSTYPCYSFAQLLAQKVRWASKFKRNKNALSRLLALLSFGTNTAWLFCFVYCYFALAQQANCLLFIFLKLSIDLLLLFLASGFIRNKLLWWFALPVGCIYPIYTMVVALASVTIKPKWKI